MIIPDSFRNQYEVTKNIWSPIKSEADGIFQNIRDSFPYSTFNIRIKPIQSTLLKAQKEGYQNPFLEMPDYFACEFVLPLSSQLGAAIKRISEEFEVTELSQRNRSPYDFRYSGKHYSLRLKDTPMRADKSVLDKVFEVQVKTFLQSAWQQAGHTVIYKPNKISYWAERIAGQLRGLLELADSVLAQIEETALLLHQQSDEEDNNYKPDLKKIIGLMTDNFEEDRLPPDKRRMAVILKKFVDIAGINIEQLEEIIIQAIDKSDPVLAYLTLNPIDQVFVLIFQHSEEEIEKKFKQGNHRVLITPEMEDFYPALRNLSDNGKSALN